jgi:hypothetical protein
MLTQIHHPVEATYHGSEAGWESNGLDYGDLSRMATHTSNKPDKSRRFPTPAWVHDDSIVCEVVTLFMEERAHLVFCNPTTVRNTREGSVFQRLERAQSRMLESRPQLKRTLTDLCARFMTEPENRKMLSILIENVDTQLRLIERGPAIAVAVLHYYYRMGIDSVGVGIELGIKPVHVRQLLHRLNKTYKVFEGIREGRVHVTPHVPSLQKQVLNADGRLVKVCIECGEPCTRKFCEGYCKRKHVNRKKREERRAAEAAERIKFCSPTCKAAFTEHPWQTLEKRLGISLDALRKEHGESYASYCLFCVTRNIMPMTAPQWRIQAGR